MDTNVVGCRKEQGLRREQYINRHDSDDEGDIYESNNETERNQKLAREGRNQEAHIAVYRQQMVNASGKRSPDLPHMRPTVKLSTTPENPPSAPDARVYGSSSLSKAIITSDSTHTSVPEDTAGEHTSVTAPLSPLITPWLADERKPSRPTINMQSAPQAEIERSGSESHDFILSALIWLVDSDSYTIKDSVVSNSMSETRIMLFGDMSGKTSAWRTYVAQNPELTDWAELTNVYEDYWIRIPMIINKFGVTQESIVNLRDTGSRGLSARHIDRFGRIPDVLILCYSVTEGYVDNVDLVGTYPQVLLRSLNS